MGAILRSAEYNSAIRQIENLRYDHAPPPHGKQLRSPNIAREQRPLSGQTASLLTGESPFKTRGLALITQSGPAPITLWSRSCLTNDCRTSEKRTEPKNRCQVIWKILLGCRQKGCHARGPHGQVVGQWPLVGDKGVLDAGGPLNICGNIRRDDGALPRRRVNGSGDTDELLRNDSKETGNAIHPP